MTPLQVQRREWFEAVQFTEQHALGDQPLPNGVRFAARDQDADGRLIRHRHYLGDRSPYASRERPRVEIDDWILTDSHGGQCVVSNAEFQQLYAVAHRSPVERDLIEAVLLHRRLVVMGDDDETAGEQLDRVEELADKLLAERAAVPVPGQRESGRGTPLAYLSLRPKRCHQWVVDATSAHPNHPEGYVYCEDCGKPFDELAPPMMTKTGAAVGSIPE